MPTTSPISSDTFSLSSARILVVDDEESNVKLLDIILRNNGYDNIIVTQDSRKVLELYQQQKSDLILLDLNMPHLDGYDVMEQLNAIGDEDLPPILVLTAQHMQEFRQRALDSGACDYVTKPFNASELLSRVRNLIQVRLAQNFIRDKNETLEQMVRDRTKALELANQLIVDSRLQIVRRLGRAAEYRDNETGLHIIRMSKIAALLGKAASMPEHECNILLNASPMHDIGKIGIPDEILLKPGKLDADEWTIMKTHAQIGADLLADDDSQLLVMARDIAITHHEKWDGSGYPNSLAGTDIPLVGRITALADVFDALTSERPYKKAWTVERAIKLIEDESGKHFDPELVDHFIEQLPNIVAIIAAHSEPETKTVAVD